MIKFELSENEFVAKAHVSCISYIYIWLWFCYSYYCCGVSCHTGGRHTINNWLSLRVTECLFKYNQIFMRNERDAMEQTDRPSFLYMTLECVVTNENELLEMWKIKVNGKCIRFGNIASYNEMTDRFSIIYYYYWRHALSPTKIKIKAKAVFGQLMVTDRSLSAQHQPVWREYSTIYYLHCALHALTSCIN